MLLFLLSTFLFSDNLVKLETRMTYERVPEDEGPMVSIVDMVMDRHDNLYVLDVDARKIFCWNSKGKYLKSFGRSGNGPGEFNFDPSYRYYYNLTILNDQLVLWVFGAQRLDFFKLDGTFLHSKYLPTSGNVRYLEANKSGNLMVLKHNYYQKGAPKYELHLYDANLKRIKRMGVYKADNRTPRYHNGNFLGWRLFAFKHSVWVHGNPGFDGALIGPHEGARIDLFDGKGDKKFSVELQIPKIDIPEHFMKEYKEVLESRPNNILETIYPDKMPYYDTLLPVPEFGYFVANNTAINRIYEGYLVSYEGKPLGRVRLQCGELGQIDTLNGHFIHGAYLEDDDDYEIKEIKFVPDRLR